VPKKKLDYNAHLINNNDSQQLRKYSEINAMIPLLSIKLSTSFVR